MQSGSQFLLGSKPSQADAEAVKVMGKLRPNPAQHPSLFFWASVVTKFNPSILAKWPAGELPMPVGVASTASPKQNADEDINEDDLFGGDDEANAEAAAELAKKKPATEKKKKAAPVAKSIVLIEVKPMSDETDLDALATKILAIQKDGLFWKT